MSLNDFNIVKWEKLHKNDTGIGSVYWIKDGATAVISISTTGCAISNDNNLSIGDIVVGSVGNYMTKEEIRAIEEIVSENVELSKMIVFARNFLEMNTTHDTESK